ncbi:MAG TPA: hypothetical protein VMB20_04230 [Candidatus Acidoferrum sp.]|nr:hypothetical protein [Candidatus Acidoferrum sp.]
MQRVTLVLFLLISAVACGGGSTSSLPLPGASPSSSPSSAAFSFTLGATQQVVQLPAVAGFSGSIRLPAASTTTTVSGTISTSVPALAQTRLRLAHPNASTYQPLLYITLTAQGAATVLGTPGYTFYLPSGVATTNTAFYLSVFNPAASTTNFLIGPATVTASGAIAFPLSTAQQIVFAGGQTFEFALFAEPQQSASATTSPSPASTLFAETSVGGILTSIATGPDDNLWVTSARNPANSTGVTGVVKLTTSFLATAYPVALPTASSVFTNIISGPHQLLWFDDGQQHVFSMTTTGTYYPYAVESNLSQITSITEGPDLNIWAAVNDADRIDQLNVTSGAVTAFPAVLPTPLFTPVPTPSAAISSPYNIAAGGANSLWFTQLPLNANQDGAAQALGSITTLGIVSYYSTNYVPGVPSSQGWTTYVSAIVSNPVDGNLWFTEPSSIGRMTPSGTLTEFPIAVGDGACCSIIVQPPNGTLWFIDAHGIGHMDIHGNFLGDYALPNNEVANSLTLGPDGNIWYSETIGNVGYLNVRAVEAQERARGH